MYLCLAAKRRLGPRVAMWWWEQEGLDLEGMRTAAREAEETDRTETATENYLSGKDNVVNITLGKEPNTPLDFALGLELHHPIMSKLGEHGGQ